MVIKNRKEVPSAKKDYPNLEEILNKHNLISEQSVLKNIIENENVQQLTKLILAATLIAGGVVIAIAAPNLLATIGRLNKQFHQKSSKDRRKSLNGVFYNLEKRKLIYKQIKNNKVFFHLTPGGRSLIINKYFKEMKINKSPKWDKVWRIILFDIPNNKNTERDIFRDKLKRMGFFQFQKSSFIIPYPCRMELEAVLEYYNLHNYVTYIETNHISGEKRCRHFFNL